MKGWEMLLAAARRVALPIVLTFLIRADPALPAQEALRGTPTAPGIQKERVSLILIDVVVTDHDGRPVEDLRPEEFTLRVDGRQVKIQSVDLLAAGTGAATPEQRPSVPSREPQSAIQRIVRSRSIVLFFDSLSSERGLGEEAIRSAREFVRSALQPTDELMVAGLGRAFKVYQEFTSDRAVALSALDRVEEDPQIRQGGEDHTESNLEMLEELARFICQHPDPVECRSKGPAGAMGASFAADDLRRMSRFFTALGALTGLLRVRQGRKEVFLFSDGFPLNPDAVYHAPMPSARTDDLLRASREAAAVQVVLNPVSTLGLTRSDAGPIAAASTGTLSALALGTGGVLIRGTNHDFQKPMRALEEESRTTYQLAYAPEGEPDGKLHSTQVLVQRDGVRVRTQEGYLWMTEAQRVERETLSAYAAPDLFHAIPVSLLVRTYLEANGKPMVEVAMELSPSSLLLLPRGGRRSGHLEAGGVLRSTDGKVEKRFSQSVQVRLPRETTGDARDLILLARRPVPPGEYEAVAVIRDIESGALGAARASVKVPSLAPEHLAMSSLVLSRPASASGRIDLDPPGSGERLLAVPAVSPIFAAGETVSASSVLYHPKRNRSTREASVILLASIQGPGIGTRKLHLLRRRFPAKDDRESIPIEFPLDLAGLAPGRYELNLQVWDEVDARGVIQKVEFLVR
jgi:VWFA-related protein